ncbi:hypothetical protein [Candidatus Poriferisodalis sp.]|uniref:hypothetical protein n=1 Tax=Candidatus Poriferisodalis sp. TaxID=3101277 RepID=UPI003B5984FD
MTGRFSGPDDETRVVSPEDHELLSRLADTVHSDIAPAVSDEYARTQAFMAAVILQRLAKQARLGSEHGAAESGDVAALSDELDTLLAGADATTDVPSEIRDAVARMRTQVSIAAASDVIDAVYQWGPERPEAASALAAIRQMLRRDIDRRMDIAR